MAGKRDLLQRFGTIMMALLFLITSLGFTGIIFWQSRRDSSQADAQQQAIQEALQDSTKDKNKEGNMLEGTKLADFEPLKDRVKELQVIDTKVGDGEGVKEGATVTAHYTGAIASSGIIFQSSKDMGQPIPFSLDRVIEGWTKGVPGMKVGGIRRLVIPASQAYGEAGSPPSIPADSDLVFDIELTKVENK